MCFISRKNIEDLFEEKIKKLIELTINDSRWNLNNETMFQVFGFTITGFSFGVGRNLYFMESDQIVNSVISKLTKLGAGEKYVRGLVDKAIDTFENETKSFQSDLVGIGFSHFAKEDLTELKDSIFSNTNIIEQTIEEKKPENNPQTKKPKKWWQFGK